MKKDVQLLSMGQKPSKILSKETLNNRDLIFLASGVNPIENTPLAFKIAYQSLGIDFINRVPLENCPMPLKEGECLTLNDIYKLSSLGLFDSYVRYHYPFDDVDDFLSKKEPENLDYSALMTPVPHPLVLSDIKKRESYIGEAGQYYCQLYTTLFMWGVEYLGWEVFLMALGLNPKKLDENFLKPAFVATLKLTDVLIKSESPFLFFHDDLATASSIVCQKSWLQEYIFPRYQILWKKVHEAGKKVIFVCDGNITDIAEEINNTGIDGVMLENPATPFETILDCFANKLIIGGIDTSILCHGTPDDVHKHVCDVIKMAERQNLVLSSCGGIHGNIPLDNLEMYFDTRAEFGINSVSWRKI